MRRNSGKLVVLAVLLAVLIVGCRNENLSGNSADTEPASPTPTASASATTPSTAGPNASQHPSEPAANEQAGTDEPTESSSQAPAASEDIRQLTFQLEAVAASETFDRPVGMDKRADRPGKLYIVEQAGSIRLLDLDHPRDKSPLVLDLTDRVRDNGNEKGLLGLAFHPARPDEAYVNYTTATHTVVSRILFDKSDSDRLDPASEQVLLTFKQPRSNHNGGQLAFGPDGLLYIATGDGGGSGDPDGNGQNKQSLLGKILRIDVDRKDGNRAYAIPADNPFVSGGGAPEVYAYGLRNPWRFSFDTKTGRLWAADVGQDRLEEINLIEAGGNYGWNVREGTACYKPAKGCAEQGMIPPIFEYGRDKGISITGGYVYRGQQIPALTGWYVYADYATGTIWALRQLTDGGVDNRTLLESRTQITSFGIDEYGEIYVIEQDGGIFRLTAQ